MDNEKAKELKNDFPILNDEKLVYLDNAATTQKPLVVIDKVAEVYNHYNANTHRGIYSLSEKATSAFEGVREKVAQFINSDADEIVFTRGTTESINLISYCLPSSKREEILLTEMEHHANILPWMELAKRANKKIVYVKMKDDFTLDYEDLRAKLTEKTWLVSCAAISNGFGTIHDIDMICSLAKEKGALSIIDGAQGAGHEKIDVKKIGCDFLALSSHKMLGPSGVGVLFGRATLLEKMNVFQTGGGMIDSVNYSEVKWAKVPHKFEAGTQNIEGVIGFGVALDYLSHLGFDEILKWEKELLSYALVELEKIPEVTLYSAGSEKSCGILSFNLKGIHTHDVSQILADEGVCVRGGHHCNMPLMTKLGIGGTVRASFYFYNTREDVDRLVKSIKKAIEVFRK